MEKKERVLEEGNKKMKKYFENKFLSKRIEFIQEYDFENDEVNYSYFKKFILNFKTTKNDWYNSLIIEIADRLNICSSELYIQYLKLLKNKINYITKLSILDYIANQNSFYKNLINEEDLNEILNQKYERQIVTNQIITNNIIFFPSKKYHYVDLLIKNLNKTDDYRSHIRLYNYIMNFDLQKVIDNKDINHILYISENKRLGRAVTAKIIEFKEYLLSNE